MDLAARVNRIARILRGSFHFSPSVNYPPIGMAPGAAKVWERVLHQYADTIYQNRISNEWDRAIRLFERACAARGIRPYR